MINRSNIAAHLDYGVRSGFLTGIKSYQPRRGPFVREVPSDGASETYADMGAIPWPIQNGGIQGPGGTDGHVVVTGRASLGQGVTIIGGEERAIRIFNTRWEVTLALTHDAINDNRTGDLEGWAQTAGQRFEQLKDYLAFNALNTGAAATSNYGLAFDGLAFFHDSHVYPRAEYTTAQDNQFTSTLNLDNFETVQVAGANFKDSRGQPLGYSHNLLIVPPALKRTARQIVGNPDDYATGNRAVNPYAGETSLVVAPGGYLDSTAWFLVEASLTQKPIIMQIREDAKMIPPWDDNLAPSGGVRYYKFEMRVGVGYGDPFLCLQGNT